MQSNIQGEEIKKQESESSKRSENPRSKQIEKQPRNRNRKTIGASTQENEGETSQTIQKNALERRKVREGARRAKWKKE